MNCAEREPGRSFLEQEALAAQEFMRKFWRATGPGFTTTNLIGGFEVRQMNRPPGQPYFTSSALGRSCSLAHLRDFVHAVVSRSVIAFTPPNPKELRSEERRVGQAC